MPTADDEMPQKDETLAPLRNPELTTALKMLEERRDFTLDMLFRERIPSRACPECEVVAAFRTVGHCEHWIKRIKEELSRREKS